jgi:hypothetical protein
MRMMMKVAIPNDGGNKAVKDGSIGRIFGAFLEEQKPESAYFYVENGERTAQFVIDVKEPSQIVPLSEPYFLALNARVTYFPVMSPHDLRTGLERLKL